MEILVVDDQITIVNGIEQGIQWESIGISKVWKAYNALDAKVIIQKEAIDVLLCDIEMPEENGLSLVRWIKQNNFEIECILLTAYADFEFAKEAVSLGVFDYLLQPARYADVQAVLQKVIERIRQKRRVSSYSSFGERFYSKKRIILIDLIKRWVNEDGIDSTTVLRELKAFDYSVTEQTPACCTIIEITQWMDGNKKMESPLLSFVIENIMTELLNKFSVSVICTSLDNDIFSCMIVGQGEYLPSKQDMQKQLSRYVDVMLRLYSCKAICFLDDFVYFKNAGKRIQHLNKKRMLNKKKESNVCCISDLQGEREKGNCSGDLVGDDQDSYVNEAVNYIKRNIEQPINRTEIAKIVNLNEDYLSRLFKRKLGISIKEFIIREKMYAAKKLIQSTDLPIGVVAAKVGYDNFAHFSFTYKNIMGKTPMEERK